MAFGQQSGPPATHRQLQDLLELVIGAGHQDFKDARGPLGLTQRQAGGKFTRDEADALIEQLQAEADAPPDPFVDDEPVVPKAKAKPKAVTNQASPRPKPAAGGAVAAARARREAEELKRLRDTPAELLAAELQRRGWAVIEP